MARATGTYSVSTVAGERVQAFVPHPLPPKKPALILTGKLAQLHADAAVAVGRLDVAGTMVPSSDWFLYGFVRKEAIVSSQIEGTQATLEDVVVFEATRRSDRPADVEVCNYVDAMAYARKDLSNPKALCVRLLCAVHKRLMKGVRGNDKQPGRIRTSQNWIGGTCPGNARFVPPPPNALGSALASLEKWLHGDDPLPPLVKAGLAHVQFETIHPFLDGNGRIGRMLIALLVEHWKLLSSPLLYVSLGFKRRRQEYYERLNAVRAHGDWEGWTTFFLECVRESADDGVASARSLFRQVNADRLKVTASGLSTMMAVRLFDLLPTHPTVTLPRSIDLLQTTKPTALKAIHALEKAKILHEITGKRRDRIYAYKAYLDLLATDTAIPQQ